MSAAVLHPLNFYAGWGLVLAGFASGATMGLGFHRDGFLGGYASLRRRLVRLGHIALVALGMMNVVFAVAVPEAEPGRGLDLFTAASFCFAAGGAIMPLVCFLAAWREPFRRLFFIPVVLLISAVVMVLASGAGTGGGTS